MSEKYYASLLKCGERYWDITYTYISCSHSKCEPSPTSGLSPNANMGGESVAAIIALVPFIAEFMEGCKTKLPLLKLNRWLGYIQGTLIAHRLTTVDAERDWTRPLFRSLDFPPHPVYPLSPDDSLVSHEAFERGQDKLWYHFLENNLRPIQKAPEEVCTCLSELQHDAYSPGGPSSGQKLPEPCKAHNHIIKSKDDTSSTSQEELLPHQQETLEKLVAMIKRQAPIDLGIFAEFSKIIEEGPKPQLPLVFGDDDYRSNYKAVESVSSITLVRDTNTGIYVADCREPKHARFIANALNYHASTSFAGN